MSCSEHMEQSGFGMSTLHPNLSRMYKNWLKANVGCEASLTVRASVPHSIVILVSVARVGSTTCLLAVAVKQLVVDLRSIVNLFVHDKTVCP